MAVNLNLTAEQEARRLTDELEPVTVDTREAFEKAFGEMLATGRPIEVPSEGALDEWGWNLDTVDEGEAYDG